MSFYYSPQLLIPPIFYGFVCITIIWLQVSWTPRSCTTKTSFYANKHRKHKLKNEAWRQKKGVKANYSTTLHSYSKLVFKNTVQEFKNWFVLKNDSISAHGIPVSVPGPALGQMRELLPSVCGNAVDPTITCNGRTLNNGAFGTKKIIFLSTQIAQRASLSR